MIYINIYNNTFLKKCIFDVFFNFYLPDWNIRLEFIYGYKFIQNDPCVTSS